MAVIHGPRAVRAPERVWFESHRPGRYGVSYRFEEPVGQVVAEHIDEVAAALDRVEASVKTGLHAVAILTYEAAPAFDQALCAHPPAELPPAWFGLYRRRRVVRAGDGDEHRHGDFVLGPWRPRLSAADHARGVSRIRDDIAAGDVYQVNFTFPVQADFRGDPAGLYRQLCRSQGNAAFCAYLDLGEVAVLSASPELFFALERGGHIETRPMKGTRRRGRWTEEDDRLARDLGTRAKDRAENVMIVDLLRNDLGRIARPGSVAVPALWQVERLETVWQMTSTVTGHLLPDVGLAGLFGALFPCGSVTGAPKIRASSVIRELEPEPRGVYTGSVGFVSPAGAVDGARLSGVEARFSVAIRTVTVDRRGGRVSAGVGGGITWDSDPVAEHVECMDKARFLERIQPEFGLLETLLFEPGTGYYLLARHLARLQASARYFGYPLDEVEVRARLDAAVAGTSRPKRVRLVLGRDGALTARAHEMVPVTTPLVAVVAREPVDSGDRFLYHKTTRRGMYDEALAQARRSSGADEAILVNERAEVTETTLGNVVVERGGQRWTPPLDSGLLPGCLRAELLASGRIRERVLSVPDLTDADRLYMINSVRRWVRLELPEGARTQISTGHVSAMAQSQGVDSGVSHW